MMSVFLLLDTYWSNVHRIEVLLHWSIRMLVLAISSCYLIDGRCDHDILGIAMLLMLHHCAGLILLRISIGLKRLSRFIDELLGHGLVFVAVRQHRTRLFEL